MYRGTHTVYAQSYLEDTVNAATHTTITQYVKVTMLIVNEFGMYTELI